MRFTPFALALAMSGPGTLAAQGTPPTIEQLSRHIDAVFATGAATGMSVAIVHGDSILLSRALGVADAETGRPVTERTRFLTASTTKALTALTAVILHEAGTVHLDSSLATLLPGAELHESLSAEAITLRDLLAMRHGIAQAGPVVARTAFTGEFDTPTLLLLLRFHGPSESGRQFEYGNLGYNIAALVLEQATGRRWQDLVIRRVIRPLGMRETGSRISSVRGALAMPHAMEGDRDVRIPLYKSDRTLHAAGGHVTTARDLARFVIAQLDRGQVEGARGVSATAIAAMQRQEIAQDRDFSFVHRHGWGLGLDIAEYEGDTLYQRNGSFTGYYSHMSFMPSRQVGVVVLTNGGLGDGGAAAEAVARGVYDFFRGGDASAVAARVDSLAERVRTRRAEPPRPAPAPPPPPTDRYAGTYVDEAFGTLRIEAKGDTVIARMGDAWGVASADPRRPGVLIADVIAGPRAFTFELPEGGGPARAVQLLGRRFSRVRD